MSPDHKEAFVALGDDEVIAVINTETLEVSRRIPSGPDPELLAVDPQGERLYIANEDDALVTVVDRKSVDMGRRRHAVKRLARLIEAGHFTLTGQGRRRHDP